MGVDYLPERSTPIKRQSTPPLSTPPLSTPLVGAKALALRCPAGLVQALDLKESEKVHRHKVDPRSLKWSMNPPSPSFGPDCTRTCARAVAFQSLQRGQRC
jgi:hypothetical protein